MSSGAAHRRPHVPRHARLHHSSHGKKDMKVSTLVGYALAATFLGTAGPAFALSTTSPNTIELQHVTVSGSTGDSGGLAAVDVRFRNNGSVTANRIDFSVETPEGGTALVA